MNPGKLLRLAATLAVLLGNAAGAQAAQEATRNHEPATDEASEMAHGEVTALDAARGKITVRHGPIRYLDMPGMTMSYRVADGKLLKGIAPGDMIDFHVEDRDSTYVITRMEKAH